VNITSDRDFAELHAQFALWRKRFPMFTHDVQQVERIVNQHIQTHSRIMVMYRQTHSKSYIEKAQQEIDAINRVLATVEKIELMAMLSRG
jgi:hypothetical protein